MSNKIPQPKKNIKEFLNNEDGKINKKDVITISMVVLAVAVTVVSLGAPSQADATCAHGNHSSHFNY